MDTSVDGTYADIPPVGIPDTDVPMGNANPPTPQNRGTDAAEERRRKYAEERKRRSDARNQGQPAKVDIQSIHGRQIDLALCELYVKFNQNQGLFFDTFLKLFANHNDFLGTFGLVVKNMQGVKDWDFDKDKIIKLSQVSPEQRHLAALDYQIQTTYITCFNVLEKLINIGYARMEEDKGWTKTFSIKGEELAVNFNSLSSVMKDTERIFLLTNTLTSKNQYRPVEYDQRLMALTLSVYVHCAVDISVDGVVVKPRIAPPPAPKINNFNNSDLVEIVRTAAKEIATTCSWSHRCADPDDPLTVIYCNLHHDREKILALPSVVDYLFEYENADFSMTNRFYYADPSAEKTVYEEYKTGADKGFLDVKALLDNSRVWRANFSKMDDFTHDLSNVDKPLHLKNTQWSNVSRSLVLREMFSHNNSPFQIHFEGSGGDKLAFSLFADRARNMFPKDWDLWFAPRVNPDGSPMAPPVKITRPFLTTHATKQGNKVVEGMVVQSIGSQFEVGSLVYWLSFPVKEEKKKQTDQEFLLNFTDLVKKIRPKTAANEPTTVLAVNHNYCEYNTYYEIYKIAKQHNYRIRTVRHPRLHNEAYTILVYNEAGSAVDWHQMLHDRARMRLQVLNNNYWRNEVIITGFVPEYKMVTTDTAFLYGVGLAIRTSQYFKDKHKTARASRIKDDEEMLNELRAGENMANNRPGNTTGPGMSRDNTADPDTMRDNNNP